MQQMYDKTKESEILEHTRSLKLLSYLIKNSLL